VGFGIFYWFKITGAPPKGATIVEITGSQFKWEFRYAGKDKVLGKNIIKILMGQLIIHLVNCGMIHIIKMMCTPPVSLCV
jgi:heme/copper-type cytochrome/quinol oxidase subunit 2